MPIAGGYVLSVSVGRAVLASTGRDWEAVGLAPTDAGTESPARSTSLMAMPCAGSPPPPRPDERPRIEAIADAVAARSERRAPALPLAAYAGSYGERAIVAEDGRLYYRRGTRPRTALIALGGNRFALDSDPAFRLDFEVSGNSATAFAMGPAGQPPQGRFARNP